jgi:hypothetical protein
MAAGMLALTNTAVAQSTVPANCNVTPNISAKPFDACQKVTDLFSFLSPQVGVALTGGNPMLGEGGTLGGPGKYSFSVHATVVDGLVPSRSVSITTIGAAIPSEFGAQRAPVPMPSADVAIGVFKGVPVGLTNVGGIDLLLGATYVPDVNRDPVSISTDGSAFAFAYGVRVGILQESALVPGVSFSIRSRKLPTSNFVYTPGNDTLTVSGASIKSQSIRLVAAKRFRFIGLAAGFGRDKFDSKSEFAAVINEQAPVPRLSVTIPAAAQEVTRSNAFLNLSLGLPKAQLVAEMGYSGKGTIQQTVNTFDGNKANAGYRYYSLGFGFRPW